MREGILVAPLNGSGQMTFDYTVNYDRFHENIPKHSWGKRYEKRKMLDAQTTQEVQAAAAFTAPLGPGDTVRVRKFSVWANKDGVVFIDLFLVDMEGTRKSLHTRAVFADGGEGINRPVDFGTHFRFYIAPAAPGASEDLYFGEINRVIGLYLLPTAEYMAQNKKDVEAKKNVDIQPGMSKEQVVGILGEPQKTITFGEKTYMKYAGLTIELEAGKVVDAKPSE